MRLLIQFAAITLAAAALELFLPWWSIAIAAFTGGWILRTNLNFVAGFLGIAVLWTITSLLIDGSAASSLSARVAATFSLPKPLLFVVTAIIGGLVGGFAATTGSALRKERRRMKYY